MAMIACTFLKTLWFLTFTARETLLIRSERICYMESITIHAKDVPEVQSCVPAK
jgi:hypothetical protein